MEQIIPKYQVSVITPFHNVDMDMFRKGYKSLQCQTIGFENIEWIVVLHNTKPEIRKDVEELLGRHENVIIKILDNDIHTLPVPVTMDFSLLLLPMWAFWMQTTVLRLIVCRLLWTK